MCNVSNRYHVTACDPLMMIRLVVIVDGEGKGEKNRAARTLFYVVS